MVGDVKGHTRTNYYATINHIKTSLRSKPRVLPLLVLSGVGVASFLTLYSISAFTPSTSGALQVQRQRHPLTPLFLQTQKNETKLLYYNIGNPHDPKPGGFGSLINNMLYVASYQRMTQGRQLVVDETDLILYRKDDNHGMISSYFDTKFPVVSNKQDYIQLQEETGINITNIPLVRNYNQQDAHIPILKVITHDNKRKQGKSRAHQGSFKWARRHAHEFFTSLNPRPSPNKIHQFYLLAMEFCHSFSLNAQTQQAIQQLLKQASVPSFDNLDKDAITTVAFHVRRGDKIKEVKHYTPAWEYVDKLQQVLTNNSITSKEQLAQVRHCFVATDDYQAFLEIQQELQTNSSIPCQVYTLATEATQYDRHAPGPRGANDLVLLLAEMKMMVAATFFIGTFTSNVGSLAALWRGCGHPIVAQNSLPPVGQEYKVLTKDQADNQLDHFFRSYGVGMETDDFSIWGCL